MKKEEKSKKIRNPKVENRKIENLENIPFPTEEEKENSIAFIVAEGVKQPHCFYTTILLLWRDIGLQRLFFGVGDCVFLAFLGVILVWTGIFASVKQNLNLLYLLIFLLSPFLYAILHLLTVWKDIMVGTYEQFMTLRISLRQMTTLRMLVFGGISVLLCVGISMISWFLFSDMASLIRMLSLSFAALFLFAWMELLVEWKWRAPLSYFIVPVSWIGIGGLLLGLGEQVQRVLLAIPVMVFLIVAFLFAGCYFYTLKKYYFDSKEGALYHVIG